MMRVVDQNNDGDPDFLFGAEGSFDLFKVASFHPLKANAQRPGQIIHVSWIIVPSRISWIDQNSHSKYLRNRLFEQFQPLSAQFSRESGEPRDVKVTKVRPVMFPPVLARLATIPRSTRSSAAPITIGIVVVAFFAASAPGVV